MRYLPNMLSVATGIVALAVATVDGQTRSVEIPVALESRLWFDGTSTLHDYSCEATEFVGSVIVKEDFFEQALTESWLSIRGFELQIPVLHIESGKDGLDKRMRKALKNDDHPQIEYKVSSLDVLDVSTEGATLQAVGRLVVGGTVRTIDLVVRAYRPGSTTVGFRGDQRILMTDFDIEPPRLMLGALRTADEVHVHFDIVCRLPNRD